MHHILGPVSGFAPKELPLTQIAPQTLLTLRKTPKKWDCALWSWSSCCSTGSAAEQGRACASPHKPTAVLPRQILIIKIIVLVLDTPLRMPSNPSLAVLERCDPAQLRSLSPLSGELLWVLGDSKDRTPSPQTPRKQQREPAGWNLHPQLLPNPSCFPLTAQNSPGLGTSQRGGAALSSVEPPNWYQPLSQCAGTLRVCLILGPLGCTLYGDL